MVIATFAKIIPLLEGESSTVKLIADRSQESPISLTALIKQGQCFSKKEAGRTRALRKNVPNNMAMHIGETTLKAVVVV